MKNSTSVITFSEIKKDTKKYAKEYSEGNKYLEICLLTLWENNIYTKGCCIGHSVKRPYISLDLTSNLKMIKSILNNIEKDDIRISFVCNEKNKGVSISSNIGNLTVFKKILNSIKENNNNIYKFEIDKAMNWEKDYYMIVYYYKDNIVSKKFVTTNNLDEINNLKYKYDYKVLNEKNMMYQFNIK